MYHFMDIDFLYFASASMSCSCAQGTLLSEDQHLLTHHYPLTCIQQNIRQRAEDPFNFRASQHHHKLVCGSTSLVVDALRIPLHLLFAAPVLVAVLLQCKLLPAQVAGSVFVYHHGKLSSSPACFQCSVSDHIFTLKHCADTPLHVWVAIMLKSYLHTH